MGGAAAHPEKESALKEIVSEVLPDVFQIRLPMTGSRLRHVNGYLFKSHNGHTLVDCGWEANDVLETLESCLAYLGIRPADLKSLVASHYHSDHYGLAGTLVRRLGVSLSMHRIDWEHVRTRMADPEELERQVMDWLHRNGLDLQFLGADERELLDSMRRYSVQAPHVELEDAQLIDVGSRSLTVVWTPGHTAGHICLYDPANRALLSGDHVLQPITPNVSLTRPEGGNPLRAYLESLDKVAALDADKVLPAHGEPFDGLRRRVDELLVHHYEREAETLAAIESGPVTGAYVARQIPWTRRHLKFDDLGALQQRMALTETLAHLEELRGRDVLEREEVNGLYYYHKVRT